MTEHHITKLKDTNIQKGKKRRKKKKGNAITYLTRIMLSIPFHGSHFDSHFLHLCLKQVTQEPQTVLNKL